jgi:bacterioferritin (cytochrome b1)
MDRQAKSLNALLRCEMTAVHQQFIHVLALREWGEKETAARIMQVDYVDFSNAMRIIDYIVETGTPIDLAPDRFAPGTDLRGILLAEQAMEQRLSAAIARAACDDERAQALVASAQGPRQAYSAWLTDHLNELDPDDAREPPANSDTAGLVAHLITMIEQAMVHAFVHWRGGDAQGADAKWATSGGAMMHLAEFTRLFAAQRSAPIPGDIPRLQTAVRPEETLDLDRRLAGLCADEAAAAAGGRDRNAVTDLCREIADYSRELSRWSPERAHPAAGTNPPAFSSFQATLTRVVHSD